MTAEIREKVAKVNALVKSGNTVDAATKQVGVSAPTYYKHRAKLKKPKKKREITLTDLAHVESSRPIFMFMGSANEIRELMRQLQ